MRFKNLHRLRKGQATANPGGHRKQTTFHSVQRRDRINEGDLAAASRSRQSSIQFIPARGVEREQTKDRGIRLREPKKCADQKLSFGIPEKIRRRAKKHVGLNFLAPEEAADLIGAQSGPSKRPLR